MNRPFIEFLQVQTLPWAPRAVPSRPEVAVRELSADPDGACSLLLRYPSGYRRDPERLGVDEELLVLDGDLRIGGVRHRRYTYAHLPAGYERGATVSEAGAVVLTFFSGAPEAVTGTDVLDRERLVEFADGFAGPWTGDFHPRFPPGAGRKFLRRDPHDGEETWLLGTMPLRSGRRPERHPVVEEMFLLSGELVGHLGRMHAGAYFWRPPEEWHGPFGSPTGNLFLFRTKGGPLRTEYTEHEVPFSWDPPHTPILPPHLAPYGREPYDPGALCH